MLSSQRNSRSPTQAFRLILIFYYYVLKYLLISHYFFKTVFQFCCCITNHLKLSGLKQQGFISHCSVGLQGSLAPCGIAEVTCSCIQLRAWLWLHHQRQSLLLNGLNPCGSLSLHSMVGENGNYQINLLGPRLRCPFCFILLVKAILRVSPDSRGKRYKCLEMEILDEKLCIFKTHE